MVPCLGCEEINPHEFKGAMELPSRLTSYSLVTVSNDKYTKLIMSEIDSFTSFSLSLSLTHYEY